MGGWCNERWRGACQGARRQTPLRGEGCGIFVWGLPAYARMRAVNVIVCAPFGQHGAGIGQQQGFVQQFIAQPSFETFDKGVLRLFSWRDLASVDLAFVGEGQDCVRGELGAVIGDDHHGFSTLFEERRQFPRHQHAGHGCVGDSTYVSRSGSSLPASMPLTARQLWQRLERSRLWLGWTGQTASRNQGHWIAG